MPATSQLDAATRFGPEPTPPRRTGRSVPVAAAVLAVVALVASASWLAEDESEVPEREVPLLVADGTRDDFTRAESPAPLGRTRTGQPWEEVSGTWAVVDGEARVVEPNDLGFRTLAVTDLGSPDGAVSVTAASMTDGVGVAFRYQDAFNYWFLTPLPSFGSWRVDRLEEGNLVEVAGLGLLEARDGSTMEVRFEGRTITIFVDGQQRQQVVDPALEQATGVGMVYVGTRPAEAAWDDLVAVPIATTPATSVNPS